MRSLDVLDDRFLGELDGAGWPDGSNFDPDNDLHVEELAGQLLGRFASCRDAEAFAWLIRLTRSRLLDIALRVVARRPGGAPAETLVESVLRRLFNDRHSAAAAASGYLVAVRGLIEQEARRSASRAA